MFFSGRYTFMDSELKQISYGFHFAFSGVGLLEHNQHITKMEADILLRHLSIVSSFTDHLCRAS